MVCVCDFPHEEFSMKVDVMEFGLIETVGDYWNFYRLMLCEKRCKYKPSSDSNKQQYKSKLISTSP